VPDQFTRHARSRWEWGSPPGRSALVREAAAADPEPARRAPKRKNTRRWCRGKPGVEHQLAPAINSYYGKAYVCGWRETGYYKSVGPPPVFPKGVPVPKYRRWGKREFVVTGREWRCFHEWQCTACGKWLGPVPECPDREQGANRD
jgi:hypothetical protein